jgi:hypothetical protein
MNGDRYNHLFREARYESDGLFAVWDLTLRRAQDKLAQDELAQDELAQDERGNYHHLGRTLNRSP